MSSPSSSRTSVPLVVVSKIPSHLRASLSSIVGEHIGKNRIFISRSHIEPLFFSDHPDRDKLLSHCHPSDYDVLDGLNRRYGSKL
nr:hypothetical protein [Tomato fruit blotch virus]